MSSFPQDDEYHGIGQAAPVPGHAAVRVEADGPQPRGCTS